MGRYCILIFALLLVLASHGDVPAAVLNSNTDYSGSGDWVGTAAPDTMTNNNGVTISGSILADDGNDQVIMETSPGNVVGVVDGGAGIDEIIYGGGTWTYGHASVVNFENFSIDASADLTLNGAWNLNGATAQVSGGSLTVNDSLTAGALTINSGSAVINGSVAVSGAVHNASGLTVASGGSLSAGSLINSANLGVNGSLIAGSLSNSGGLAVGGSLSAGSLINSGALGLAGSLNVGSLINSGGIGVGGSLTVDSLVNSGALGVGTSLIAGSLINSGNLGVGGSVTADSLINSGNLGVGGSLTAGSLINSGSLAVGGSLTVGSLSNSGFLAVGGSLTADNLDNTGTLDANGSLSVGSLTNSGELTVTSGGSLSADSLYNSGSAYVSGNAIISGSLVNSGYLSVDGSLNAGSLNNSGIAYLSGRTMVVSKFTNSGELTLASGGSLNAGSFNNSGYAVIYGTATVTGNTDNSGSLVVNDSFSTASLINSGCIGGSGIIHGSMVNTGVLSPGNSIGTLTVASSVVFEPGSTLAAELDCTCLCDLLNVSGTVAINGGSISTAIPRDLYVNGFSWCVITSSQNVSGLFDAIDNQTKSAVISLSQANTGNALSLVINRKSYGTFASGGAADTGRGLDGLVPLASGDMKNLLVSMDFDLEAEQIAKVVNALNPEIYTAFSAASLQTGHLFDSTMARRLREIGQRKAFTLAAGLDKNGLAQLAAARAAPVAGVVNQAPRGWGMWGRALGLWADQDQAGGYLGRGQTTGGAAIGADCALTDWLLLGLAVGATRTDLSWSGGSYDGGIDAMHTGFYARAGSESFFSIATISYSRFANSATRPINFDGFSSDAKVDFDADLYAAGITLGYQLRVEEWLLEPMARLDYQHLKEGGFSESGADWLGLDIANRDTDTALFNLGLSATRLVLVDDWEVLPRLGISWQHRFGDDRPSLQAAFAGYGSAPFTVHGAEFVSDLALFEAGLSLAMRPGLDLFADCSLAYADDYQAQTLTAGLKISW